MNQLAALPSLAFFSPNEKNFLDSSSSVYVTFKTPVDFRKLTVHSFPNDDLAVIHQGYLGNRIPFGRSIVITPNTTLPAGEQVMMYISDIKGPMTQEYGGELLLEFNTPDPVIEHIDPPDKSEDVQGTQSFTLTFSSPIGFENEWKVESEPYHPLFIEQTNEKTLRINSHVPFRQGTSYSLNLLQQGVIRNKISGEIIKKSDVKAKDTIDFRTIKPAFIKNFEPHGTMVLPTEDISTQFDEPMDIQSVNDSFVIDPIILPVLLWNTEATEVVITHKPFEKDKTYIVTLKKGIKTKVGGILETDTVFQFQTVGPLQVLNSSPEKRETDVSINSRINIQFNQEVQERIQDRFIIDPPVSGSMLIAKDSIEFTPSKPLAFNTKYTVTIPQGSESVYGLPSISAHQFSFTTSPEEISLAVPYFKQQQLFTCNIAAARMLLAFRGVIVDEQTLVEYIGNGGKRGSGNPFKGYIDDYGTYWDAVERGIAKFRPYRRITSGKLSDIIREIKNGSPVMIWGQNGWSDPHDLSWTTKDGTYIKAVNGMHSSVVRGFRGPEEHPTHILLNDPWRGQYAIDTQEFMRRWGYLSVALVIE